MISPKIQIGFLPNFVGVLGMPLYFLRPKIGETHITVLKKMRKWLQVTMLDFSKTMHWIELKLGVFLLSRMNDALFSCSIQHIHMQEWILQQLILLQVIVSNLFPSSCGVLGLQTIFSHFSYFQFLCDNNKYLLPTFYLAYASYVLFFYF